MRHVFRRCAATFALLCGLFPLPEAQAQPVEPGKEGELARFVPPTPGAHACVRRSYDADHLKQHPAQAVAEMEVRIAYYVHEPDPYSPEGQRNYYFEVLARLRDQMKSKPLTAIGECTITDGGREIFCGVDCDGGGVVVRKLDADKVLVDLESMGRLRMTLGCGEDETDTFELSSGEDDKRFLLSRIPDAECPAYDSW